MAQFSKFTNAINTCGPRISSRSKTNAPQFVLPLLWNDIERKHRKPGLFLQVDGSKTDEKIPCTEANAFWQMRMAIIQKHAPSLIVNVISWPEYLPHVTRIVSIATHRKIGFSLSILAVNLMILPVPMIAKSTQACIPPFSYFDATSLANHFGLKQGDLYWNPFQDLNKDEVIDIFDAIVFASGCKEIGFLRF